MVSSWAWSEQERAPYLVLVVGVEVEATLLWALPVGRNALVDVCLVDDLGDQLWRMIDCAGVGGGQFSAKNGVLPAGRDQKTQQCPDAMDGEAEDQDGHEKEDGDAFAHVGCWRCCITIVVIVITAVVVVSVVLRVSFSSEFVVVHGQRRDGQRCSRGSGEGGSKTLTASQNEHQRRSSARREREGENGQGGRNKKLGAAGESAQERERQCQTPISVNAARQGSGVGAAIH